MAEVKPGIKFVNGSELHIAINRLQSLCGAGNPYGQPDDTTDPVGAVTMDDPHLCPQCRDQAGGM